MAQRSVRVDQGTAWTLRLQVQWATTFLALPFVNRSTVTKTRLSGVVSNGHARIRKHTHGSRKAEQKKEFASAISHGGTVQCESMQPLQPIGEEPIRQVDGNPAATHISNRTRQVIDDLNRVKPREKLRSPLIGYGAGKE